MSGERLLHPQRGAHGPLGVVLVGDRRAEQGDDGVADDLVDLPAEGVDVGDEPLEAAVDEVLHLLGIAGLGQRREADEVGEEDRDDPTLVAPQPQVVPARGAEPCARRHVRMAAGAGHHGRIYRGGLGRPSPFGGSLTAPRTGSGTTPMSGRPATAGTVPRMTMTSPTPRRPTTAAARAEQAVKVYGTGDTEVRALDDVTVDFETGRFTAIMGPSGSGKSTLMHCVAGLDTLTSGRVFIGDTDLTTLNDKELTQLRRDKVGFVFQAFNLIPTLDAIENITLPMDLAGRKPDQAWVDQVVATVGLGDRLKHRPSELSGGQQQRVAVARALAAQPEIIFADEPTGNLDSRAGAEILTFMRKAVDELGQTIVMVTHDPVAAAYADRVVFLADGRIVDEMQRPDRRAGARPDEGPRGRLMLRVTLRSFWAHKRRLISTVIAIVLGVAFMAGTFVLTDTLDKVFDDLFAEGNAKVDAQVQGEVLFSDPFGGGDQRAPARPRASSTSSPASTASRRPSPPSSPSASGATTACWTPTASPSARPTARRRCSRAGSPAAT